MKAELARTWFGAAFDNPTGPLADFLELAAAGIIVLHCRPKEARSGRALDKPSEMRDI